MFPGLLVRDAGHWQREQEATASRAFSSIGSCASLLFFYAGPRRRRPLPALRCVAPSRRRFGLWLDTTNTTFYIVPCQGSRRQALTTRSPARQSSLGRRKLRAAKHIVNSESFLLVGRNAEPGELLFRNLGLVVRCYPFAPSSFHRQKPFLRFHSAAPSTQLFICENFFAISISFSSACQPVPRKLCPAKSRDFLGCARDGGKTTVIINHSCAPF